MSCTIKELLAGCEDRFSLQLCAGEEGLSSEAVWVYLAEDIENLDFIRKNQLIVTTGYFTQNGISPEEFLTALIDRGQASGILINTGKYISPESVNALKELCDKKAFPLFTIPWEVHLADIMQELCGRIFRSSQRDGIVTAAVINALTEPSETDSYVDALGEYGFTEETEINIILFDKEYSHGIIKNVLNYADIKSHIIDYRRQTLVLTADCGNIMAVCKGLGNDYRIGISPAVKGVRALCDCFRYAGYALSAAEILNENIMAYEDIGILSLILSANDKKLTEDFCRQRLLPLEQYDRAHNGCLVETLFHYIRSNGSLAETAERLYTHRNTIGYRMNKIRELTNGDVDRAEERLNYLAAIYIKKTMESKKAWR